MAIEGMVKTRKSGIWLKKVARISAWALLVCVIFLVLSGWGITQTGVIYNLTFGLIDRGTANAIHRATNIPLAFFFLLHVFISISLKVTGRSAFVFWLVNGILIAFGLLIFSAFIYMEYFRLGG